MGDRPSHPELLDDLAARFVAAGWSLKWLHREIVLSATYRQSAVHPNSGTTHDPARIDGGNRLLWRMNRRRLEPEAWRDAVLSLSGVLDGTMTGPSTELDDAKHLRRTLYGRVSRQTQADVLRLFDFPDAKQHAEERIPTTTPLQQLFLLNSPFLQRHATRLAACVASNSGRLHDSVRELFLRILQREPNELEMSAALQLLGRHDGTREQAWQLLAHGLLASNEFLYVD